jgi:hypothetical protein
MSRRRDALHWCEILGLELGPPPGKVAGTGVEVDLGEHVAYIAVGAK